MGSEPRPYMEVKPWLHQHRLWLVTGPGCDPEGCIFYFRTEDNKWNIWPELHDVWVKPCSSPIWLSRFVQPISHTCELLDWATVQRTYVDMPEINVNTITEVLSLKNHPNLPKDKRAVAIVIGLSAEEYTGFERFISGTAQSPTLRLGYGADERGATETALRKQLKDMEAQLNKQLADIQAELNKYKLAYEKNPPPEAGRFGCLEVD